MAFSSGYDMSDDYKFADGLAKLYTILAGAWTIILICGALVLIYNRNLPYLRIRNVPLIISAVATLHVYWILCMIAYGLNGHWPCRTEFWIMNIYLPLGIALFHASNSQLLFIARAQQRYTSFEYIALERSQKQSSNRIWQDRFAPTASRKPVRKTMHLIAMGILAQFVVAVVIFFLSKRFVPDFGVIGEDLSQLPLQESRKLCRQGFEWLPSIFWQFFWAWIYAPYILWNVRHIHDVHGWRIQTIFCCLAGLPASPLWLIALYLPQMANVSRYFIPPLWFVPSIFLIEFFMIFTPCWQIVRNRKLKKETLEIIAEWERQKNHSSLDSGSTKIGTISSASNKTSVTSTATLRKAQSHLFTMTALEKALEKNSHPLLMFAALKDFSGENIGFLVAVREWKQTWTSVRGSAALQSAAMDSVAVSSLHQQQFHRAIEIYSTFVSAKHSVWPINISSLHLKKLEAIFEELIASANENDSNKRNAATPFDDWEGAKTDGIELATQKDCMSTVSTMLDDNVMETITSDPGHHSTTIADNYRVRCLDKNFTVNTPIPEHFDSAVFDEAVDSIKYTVLTNTWPKFVNAGYAALDDNEAGSPLERLQDHLTVYRTGFARLFSL